jgi:hypothetical protein
LSLEVGANGRGLMSAIAEPPHMAHTAAQVFHCQNSCLNCSCSAAAGQQRTSRPGRRADGPTDQPTGICGASQVLQARVSNTSTSSSTLLRRRRRAAAESGRRSHCGSSAGRPGRARRGVPRRAGTRSWTRPECFGAARRGARGRDGFAQLYV